MSRTKTLPWDAADHLRTPKQMASYLGAALEDGGGGVVEMALGTTARAKGMTRAARNAGLGRASPHESISAHESLDLATVLEIVEALGLRLHASAASNSKSDDPEGDPIDRIHAHRERSLAKFGGDLRAFFDDVRTRETASVVEAAGRVPREAVDARVISPEEDRPAARPVLDTVVLLDDRPASGLRAGDVGTVVESRRDALVVKFATGRGTTQALLTLTTSQVRAIAHHEILTVRRIGASEAVSTGISVKGVHFDEDSMHVGLTDGRTVSVPLTRFPRLLHASPAESERYAVSVHGLRWDELVEDISVAGLLKGRGNRTTR